MAAPGEIEVCLRVLARMAAEPDNPQWNAVRQAVDLAYKAGKKRRKVERRTDRARHDRRVTAATARHQEQCPGPPPATGRPGTLIGSRRCYVCKAAYRP